MTAWRRWQSSTSPPRRTDPRSKRPCSSPLPAAPAGHRRRGPHRRARRRALGLRAGPVHAELRVTGTRTAMLELAARSIGGLCSRALRFPGGKSLEELIIAGALGAPAPAASEAPRPCGIFMLPVPRAGVLRAVEGRAAAEAVPGITGVTI